MCPRLYVQNPQKGVFGPNAAADAVVNWGHRLPFRKNQALLRAGGL